MKNRGYNKPWHWKPGKRELDIWKAVVIGVPKKLRRSRWAEKYQITQERVRQLEKLMERYIASGRSG